MCSTPESNSGIIMNLKWSNKWLGCCTKMTSCVELTRQKRHLDSGGSQSPAGGCHGDHASDLCIQKLDLWLVTWNRMDCATLSADDVRGKKYLHCTKSWMGERKKERGAASATTKAHCAYHMRHSLTKAWSSVFSASNPTLHRSNAFLCAPVPCIAFTDYLPASHLKRHLDRLGNCPVLASSNPLPQYCAFLAQIV